jgi:predicted dehydrogenase
MKILIIGLGSIAKKHIKALNTLGIKAELYALRFQKNAVQEEGITNLFYEQEIDNNFDFGIISNPTSLHFQSIDLLIKRNIPLFIEKPPLASLIDAEELNNRIIKAGIKTYVACNLRFHPCLEYLKNLINSNPETSINEVNVYCGSYLPDWRPNLDFRQNYSANKSQGGGVHLDLFHELDYTHWIFGNPKSVNSFKSSKSSLNIDAIDYANYILEYDNYAVSVILNYYRKIAKRTIEIVFEDRVIGVDLIKNKVVDNEKILFSEENFDISNTYVKQMDFFINQVLIGKNQMNSFTESLEVLNTCLHSFQIPM